MVGENLALKKPTTQSTTSDFYYSSYAVDGLFNTNALSGPYCAVTSDPAGGPNWWMVDLQQIITIGYVVLTNRADCCGKDDVTGCSPECDCVALMLTLSHQGRSSSYGPERKLPQFPNILMPQFFEP